jgi:hypothetical protein
MIAGHPMGGESLVHMTISFVLQYNIGKCTKPRMDARTLVKHPFVAVLLIIYNMRIFRSSVHGLRSAEKTAFSAAESVLTS